MNSDNEILKEIVRLEAALRAANARLISYQESEKKQHAEIAALREAAEAAECFLDPSEPIRAAEPSPKILAMLRSALGKAP